jgi:hypothetical protein
MRIQKQDVPVKLAVPGATARQLPGFGTTDGGGDMAAEYFSLGAGTDIAPLLKGLEGDLCQAPHWGHVVEGELVVTYADGSEDTCVAGDLFFWPSGHTVRVVSDAEVVLFSPAAAHAAVIEHMGSVIEAMSA